MTETADWLARKILLFSDLTFAAILSVPYSICSWGMQEEDQVLAKHHYGKYIVVYIGYLSNSAGQSEPF